jgi:transmembrane sensor
VVDRILHVDKQAQIFSLNEPLPRQMMWRRIAVAVIIFGVIICGSFFLLTRRTTTEMAKAGSQPLRLPKDIIPRGNNAILTLSNGSIINLDSAKNGMIAEQGYEKVVILDSGLLAYTPAPASINGVHSTEIIYNTISTPRAAQYQLVLSDGTKVWLNAASSLRFPIAFTGKDRIVELTGEGYFEVTKNREKPFHVRTGGLEVEVFGTHFDIMAYEDESAIQTTLLEGVVKVSHDKQSDLLEPGKQARLARDNNNLTVIDANVKQAVAWKNGYFYFDKSDVKTIMRQVSRWYDLDIVYESPVPDMQFSGKIERNLPLSGIAHLLESGQIHFRIEGKKCIMMR